MSRELDELSRFVPFLSCFMTFFLILGMPTYSQQSSYSTAAQIILDNHNTSSSSASSDLDVFSFSVNDILNTQGATINNAAGDPKIFGRTDYGSEFALTNDLSTSFSIEIPAFVINDLAENDSGEYFPVLKNGDNDAEDGTYTNYYVDDALGTQVTEYFNAEAPNKIETIYDYGTTEIEYLSDNGIDVKNHIYQDGAVYKTYFQDDETNILASTNLSADGSTSRFFSDPVSNYTYSTSNNLDGSINTSFYDGTNASYSQTVNSNNELVSSSYYNDGVSLHEVSNDDGSSQTTFSDVDNDGSGNFKTIVENRNATNSITNLQYTDNDNTTPIEFTLDNVTDTGVVVTQTFKSNSVDSEIVKTITEGDIKIVYGGVNVFEYKTLNKNNLINQASEVITNGESVISNGITTVTEANNATNPNRLAIDFKELYDSEDGLAITPEMGYVRLNSADGNKYINLSDGDVIEFFVRPTDTYLANHNSEDLFFIDRAVPENPVVADTDTRQTDYNTSESISSELEATINVGPGEEAVTLPSGEIRVYVTTVYVRAPASKFLPSQIVMPVKSDGDFNYDIEPAPAETFSDETEVVAIPEEKAKEIVEKIKQIKEEKASTPNPKHDEDAPPALDPGIEVMIKLNALLNDVQKAPSILLSETKKTIQKEFPNISEQLINFIINQADDNEKFNILRNPKEFLDNEFSKVSNPLDLDLILNTDLSQKDFTKIYNLILYKFSKDLADLGFEALRSQKIDFSDNVMSANQILELFELQRDIMATASLFTTDEGNGALSNLIIEPLKKNPYSSASLFESNNSQRVLDQMMRFSKVIDVINNSSSSLTISETNSDNNIPIVEINVQLGENITDALQKKLFEDSRVNRNFQTRSQSSKLERFDFEIPTQEESSVPPELPPLLTEAPNISDEELQLVAETTEATDNILDATIDRMILELGAKTLEDNTIQLVSASNDGNPISQESDLLREDLVFSNALSSAQRLQEVEDIRAIFQILGIGS